MNGKEDAGGGQAFPELQGFEKSKAVLGLRREWDERTPKEIKSSMGKKLQCA